MAWRERKRRGHRAVRNGRGIVGLPGSGGRGGCPSYNRGQEPRATLPGLTAGRRRGRMGQSTPPGPTEIRAMSLLGKLEDRFGRFAVPQLTLAVIICQVAVYGLTYL